MYLMNSEKEDLTKRANTRFTKALNNVRALPATLKLGKTYEEELIVSGKLENTIIEIVSFRLPSLKISSHFLS